MTGFVVRNGRAYYVNGGMYHRRADIFDIPDASDVAEDSHVAREYLELRSEADNLLDKDLNDED